MAGIYGPEYTKIQTLWMRDERGTVIPGEFSLPELKYLAHNDWDWTEKINGTNTRLTWNGSTVTIGGRTDNASIPQKLIAALDPVIKNTDLWHKQFAGSDDVTVYGEGYGAGIQSGGNYRPNQSFIVFDVRVGEWWLQRGSILDVAHGLGLAVVPLMGTWNLHEAWDRVKNDDFTSAWEKAPIEGIVGKPAVELTTRKGERLLVKLKIKDWQRYKRTQEKESG